MSEAEAPGDREEGLALIRQMADVSRETVARLDAYAALLVRWQRAKNLVGPETLRHLWVRHFADSAQLLPLAPKARCWVDLGSGAGLPGMVVAILLADLPDAEIHLVESNARKCAFLRAAARETGAPAKIHATRIADFVTGFRGTADAVTARALAPLEDLVAMTSPLIDGGATGLFHKGREVEAELTAASGYWKLNVERVPSRTHSDGTILVLHGCAAKGV